MDLIAADKLSEMLEAEKARTCGEESQHSYSVRHRERFADVLGLCRKFVPNPSARVLDIGRSELTSYLMTFYRNVHTLGLDPKLDDGGHREVSSMDAVPHIVFDLLHSDRISDWPQCEPFDLIVFSEVIEHLSLAPEYVFAALRAQLTAHGVLICTTPNAADIAKRIRLVLGRNPYERLRLYSLNPGHIREYTARELREIAQSVGFQCVHQAYFNWLPPHNRPASAFIKKLARSYPPFRSFQACVLKKIA